MNRTIMAYKHSTTNSKVRESEMASWIFDLDVFFFLKNNNCNFFEHNCNYWKNKCNFFGFKRNKKMTLMITI